MKITLTDADIIESIEALANGRELDSPIYGISAVMGSPLKCFLYLSADDGAIEASIESMDGREVGECESRPA